MSALDIVYADAQLLVFNKPPGLLSVPGKSSDVCLSLQAQQEFPDALVVHRLDMATSGLMLMARGIAMQRLLNNAFSERLVHKRYVAVVQGNCSADAGLESEADGSWQTIDLPIIVDWPQRPLRKICFETGKLSQTRWRLQRYNAQRNLSRLELEPVTGRSHQLRVHLKAIGHPIVGDALYAPTDLAAASPRLLLHSADLALQHPASGEWLSFHVSDDFGTWP